MQLWVADGEAGLMRWERGEWQAVGESGEALCAAGGRIYCAGAGRCRAYQAQGGEQELNFALPGGVCAMLALRGRVFALSQDADSVHAYAGETGNLLFSTPAGAYPRDMCADADGRYLAVAGGAAGEIRIMDDCLQTVKKYRVPGTACGVCFCPRCLMALCAVEDGEVQSRLYRISLRGVMEEIWACALPPSCLCALPGGGWAVGCHGMAAGFFANKKTAWRQLCPCPTRLGYGFMGPWICDPWQGYVLLSRGKILYRGKAPQDAVFIP